MSTTTVTESGEPLDKPNQPIDKERRATIAVAAVVGGAGVVAAAVPFVTSLMPSERAKAAGAPVEADISGMAPGEMRSFEWQGRPVWVLNRTPQMLQSIRKADGEVADPKSVRTAFPTPIYARNEFRSIKPEYLVAVGICTHLGCNPIGPFAPGANSMLGAEPGFVCPCHGSTFDLAGRVYKNKPAPDNLPVPPHKYLSANVVLIGDDSKG
ncbi:MAG TPA: ubiquinol-cytochrome c reductase iron-sulfur subunit [Burkholderiaceae bacterium]|nr:ubiquinol-cytochrome c reductase iron-sulfur subunit [Burkholderiaceae bacterium]